MDGTKRGGTIVSGAVLILLGLPLVLALSQEISFSVRNRTNGTIVSSGQKRTYLLHVPPGYRRAKPASLVISLHGAAGWPVQQMETSRWNRLADEQGFIVVFPSGLESAGPRLWHVGQGAGLERDVRFISELIDALSAAYAIDATRIYANGLSNGGAMAFVLSCTLSDRIAAIGMVASAQTLPWSWCADRRAVPMIAFHGTKDPIIPYGGGRSPIAPDLFPSVPVWTARWARQNGCGASVESRMAADVTRIAYGGCTDAASVVLYRVEGGGHSWPGGKPLPEWLVGTTSDGIDATRVMWEFFREHPLRHAASASVPSKLSATEEP
ncbi:MAG: PHB depolymerase family esterase [Thermoanaerobaculia bacterium]